VERQLAVSSFIVDGGKWMQVIVWAASPGAAIAGAQRYRVWLLEHAAWGNEAKALEVIDASTIAPALR
jgi:hypothetical protein